MELDEVEDIVKHQINYHAQGFDNPPQHHCVQQDTKFLVQLHLTGGFYFFMVDPKEEVSYDGLISVDVDFRNHGLGRLLVETREAICNDLEANLVVVNNNHNQGFWDHLGYDPMIKNFTKIADSEALWKDPCFKFYLIFIAEYTDFK